MFEEFPKIARLNREVIVTEKIDGTNAQIYIEKGSPPLGTLAVSDDGQFWMVAGSRNRLLDIHDDNFGFANWAKANATELFRLGPGRHFGEWWGSGIQRGYGLPKGEKRFSLFNVSRWGDDSTRPGCCHVVPVLASGLGIDAQVDTALFKLHLYGSLAAPGFKNPEGVIVFHTAANRCFKVTLEKDDEPKSKVKAA